MFVVTDKLSFRQKEIFLFFIRLKALSKFSGLTLLGAQKLFLGQTFFLAHSRNRIKNWSYFSH